MVIITGLEIRNTPTPSVALAFGTVHYIAKHLRKGTGLIGTGVSKLERADFQDSQYQTASASEVSLGLAASQAQTDNG